MKKSLKLFKNFFGEIILTIGTGIFFYNIFNFSNKIQCEKAGSIGRNRAGNELADNLDCVVAYHYNSDVLLLISIGVMLIVAGILIIRNKK
ncbi:MAG: hypothetical protein U9O66_03230 [Patescibacteria group bacterium]|nr:hypothetical protein [Patescibacteria group bacterium]